MIRFNCTECQAVFEIDDTLAGQKAKCFNCKARFIVPLSNEVENINNTEAIMAMFEAKCPFCGAGFQAENEWIGQIGECPSCGKEITIQAPERKVPTLPRMKLSSQPLTSSNTTDTQPVSKQEIPETPANDEQICPFCGETIKDAAIKCRFCQSDLTGEPNEQALSMVIASTFPNKNIHQPRHHMPPEYTVSPKKSLEKKGSPILLISVIVGIAIIVLIFTMPIIRKSINIVFNGKTSENSPQDSESQLTVQKEQIISEMNTLLAGFPDSQKKCLIYGNSTNSDDKANALTNLMDRGLLNRFTALAEKLNKIEGESKSSQELHDLQALEKLDKKLKQLK